MAQDKRRHLEALDDVGRGECLARTGDAEENLRVCAGLKSLRELIDCLRLVTGRSIRRFYF